MTMRSVAVLSSLYPRRPAKCGAFHFVACSCGFGFLGGELVGLNFALRASLRASQRVASSQVGVHAGPNLVV